MRVGDAVRILETFISDSNINGPIKKGTVLVVKKVNKDGSLAISNGVWNKNEIIKRKNVNKILKMKVSLKIVFEYIKNFEIFPRFRNFFFIPSPQTEKKCPKRWTTFFVFRNFHCRV